MSMTFREELIHCHSLLGELKWLQGQINKIEIEIAKTAEIVCTHADATKGQALLIQPESLFEIEQEMKSFTAFILQPENWSRQDYTQNLKLQTLTQVRSHPSVDGFTPESESPASNEKS